MWSKLLPPEKSLGATPIVYRVLGPGEAAPRTSVAVVPRESVEASREADQLRARIAELEQLLVTQVTAARQTAHREGLAAGRSEAESAMKPVMERMVRSIQDLIELKPKLRKELEEDAVKLSVAIAKRILCREIQIDPSALHGLIQVAFERMGRNEITRVLVHPEHASSVREALGALTTRHIEIFADGSREKGTLVFETERGALDASVESQLREIELGLADRLKWR